MRKALGKGLEALFPESTPSPGPMERWIPANQIRSNRDQPRLRVDEDGLEGLAESIRQHGIIQPLLVRQMDGGFELIAGERRWRAAIRAGLDPVPAIVREATDAESFELALIENIQREDLNPLEEAQAYQRLIDEFGLTQDKVATRVGKSRATVANLLRLLGLPAEVKEKIAAGVMAMGHARALLAVSGGARQAALAQEVVERGLSVRETERLAAKPSKHRRTRQGTADVHVRAIEAELCRLLGTRVRLIQRGQGGAIDIQYHSPDERERLLDYMRSRDVRESNTL